MPASSLHLSFQLPDDLWLAHVGRAIAPVTDNRMPIDHDFDSQDRADHSGSRVGPYALVRHIGSGGMGTVWLAERVDGHFDQTVAVKLIKRGMDVDEIVRRFHQERQVLATLNHSNIARLLDGGTLPDERPYLVMEYVEGETLLDYCDHHRLETDARLQLFRTVCIAAQHAHANLVLHRDLKPTNILVTTDGEVKLLDFGIAKLLDEDLDRTALTQTDARALTPRYASPEQVQGARLTTSTDIYSLGVILYELLAGQSPYALKRGTNRELERLILEGEFVPPSVAIRLRDDLPSAKRSQLVRRVRGDLDAIVLKSLARRPQDRYASAEQFGEDLKRHLDGMPLLARRPSPLVRLYRLMRRRRGALGAAAVGALLSLSIAAAVVVNWFLVPGWITEHTAQARGALVLHGNNNAVYNILFFRRNRRPDDVERGNVLPDRLKSSLNHYNAAIQWGETDSTIKTESQTVRLALATITDRALTRDFRRELAEKIPQTLAFADRWKEEPEHFSIAPEILDNASELDLRCLGLIAMLFDESNPTVVDAWSRLQLTSTDPLVEPLLGNLYLALNRPALAYPRLLSAYRTDPGNADLRLYLADAAARCGDVEQAELLLSEYSDTAPEDLFLVADRVKMLCLLESDRTDDAVALYLESGLPRNNAIATVQLVNHLEREGRLDEAVRIMTACAGFNCYAYTLRKKYVDLLVDWWARLPAMEKSKLIAGAEQGHTRPTSLQRRLYYYRDAQAILSQFGSPHPLTERARWIQTDSLIPEEDRTRAKEELIALGERFPLTP